MADNSEIIIGGGQAVKPDQATIDALVEKLKEKLKAREMIQEKIDELLAKYRESLPKWLTLTHKYITLYPLPTGNADYNRDYETIYTDSPVFEEVNWSAVDYPEERPDEYRFSRRLSNMYHYTDDPVDWKFPDVDTSIEEEELHWTFNEETGEYEQVPRTMVYKADAAGIIDRRDQSTSFRLATYNHNDDIRTIFFLEIIWGYSGWEWHDYERVIGTDPETEEPITETLKGGNLYKIKEIQTVPHIIDGFRLQHINDFLNSQSKDTTVEDFDTSNLIAMNRAFKRLELKHGLNTITPLLLKVYRFPNVEEANDVFYNNKISVINNNSIEFPLLENVDGFYQRGEFIDGTTFKLNNLESFTDGFFWTNFSQTDFNLSDILIGDSLKRVNNLSGLLQWAMFYNGKELTGYDKPVNVITIDLSGSELLSSDSFNLSNLAYYSGTAYRPSSGYYPNLTDRYFIFNLTLKGKTDLSSAFRKIMNGTPDFDSQLRQITIKGVYYNVINYNGPSNIVVNFNNTESLIDNLDYAFGENTFIEQPPVTHWINNTCSENRIYYICKFNDGIVYDFSPNHILNPSEGQFNGSYIDPTKTIRFDNVDALQKVRFQSITFGTETVTIDGQQVTRNIGIPFPFNGPLCNFQDYQYNDDPTDLYRYINFSGSMFTELQSNQTIYATGKSAASMFDGCRRIDFAGDNITIEISPTYSTGQSYNATTWTMFKNCSEMTKTPKLKAPTLSFRGVRLGDNLTDMFTGCTSLTEIDASQMYGPISGYGVVASCPNMINLTDCKNLEILDFGDVHGGFNLKGLYNLDAAALGVTLERQTHIGWSGNTDSGLWIQESVYNRLPTSTKNHIEDLIARGLCVRNIWPDEI